MSDAEKELRQIKTEIECAKMNLASYQRQRTQVGMEIDAMKSQFEQELREMIFRIESSINRPNKIAESEIKKLKDIENEWIARCK